MAIIKLSPEGKVITKGGLPSCTCCGECPEETEICMAFNDYAIGLQNITLTGSLNGGSFTGVYDPCGAAYPIALIWDGAAWGFWYNGVRLVNNPPDEIATISGETEKCNPIGATITYEDAMIIVDAEVLNFGACPCECLTDALYDFGADTYAIGRHWRTEAVLTGGVVELMGFEDQFYADTYGGGGDVTFSICSVQTIFFRIIANGGIGLSSNVEFWLGGVLIHTVTITAEIIGAGGQFYELNTSCAACDAEVKIVMNIYTGDEEAGTGEFFVIVENVT
jgi:hypothetical protein